MRNWKGIEAEADGKAMQMHVHTAELKIDREKMKIISAKSEFSTEESSILTLP